MVRISRERKTRVRGGGSVRERNREMKEGVRKKQRESETGWEYLKLSCKYKEWTEEVLEKWETSQDKDVTNRMIKKKVSDGRWGGAQVIVVAMEQSSRQPQLKPAYTTALSWNKRPTLAWPLGKTGRCFSSQEGKCQENIIPALKIKVEKTSECRSTDALFPQRLKKKFGVRSLKSPVTFT